MAEERKDQRIPIMMSAREVEQIDAWRRTQPDLPSRAEAIRRLVDLGIAAAPRLGSDGWGKVETLNQTADDRPGRA